MSPAQMKLLLYLFPGIMFAVGAFLPAALQFVFLTSGTLGFMQARILRSPTIRRWLKLLPLTISVPMAHPAFKSSSKQVQKSMEEIARKKAPKPKSIIEQAKSTGSSFVEKLNGQAGKPKESQFSREAKNYEKRRREQLRREEDMKKRY
jgi:membrane protein insertase Oxa1/YidC/SpoIIIJ